MKEEEVSPEMMQKSVAEWVTVQEELRREMLERIRAARDRKHVAASAGSMLNFEVGDYVLVARVRKGQCSKVGDDMEWTEADASA